MDTNSIVSADLIGSIHVHEWSSAVYNPCIDELATCGRERSQSPAGSPKEKLATGTKTKNRNADWIKDVNYTYRRGRLLPLLSALSASTTNHRLPFAMAAVSINMTIEWLDKHHYTHWLWPWSQLLVMSASPRTSLQPVNCNQGCLAAR